MKKRIILLSTVFAVILLVAFAFADKAVPAAEDQELASIENTAPVTAEADMTADKKVPVVMFDLGPRFNSIKKSELDKATSFEDFIGQKHANRIIKYKSLSVIELDDDKKTDRKITTNSGEFNKAQRDHLQAAGLSTNILIWAEYTEKWEESGLVEDSYWTPHLTVVPEKQAAYIPGEKAFIAYMEENIPEFRNFLRKEQLQPGRIYFTVGKEGIITQVDLQATSGIPELDEKLVKLIHKAPGKWTPAENVEGEKVAQVLVVFFGSLGC